MFSFSVIVQLQAYYESTAEKLRVPSLIEETMRVLQWKA